MKSLLTASALLVSATLGGCASITEPHQYQDDHSEAYNVARAGGLVQAIKDTEVPRDHIGSLTESMSKVGFVASGYMDPQLGMSRWQTMGVNLASELLEPDKHGARNSMMSWMPLAEAGSTEGAQAKMVAYARTAVDSALSELGVQNEVIYDRNGTYVVQVVHEPWSCPEYEAGVTNLDDLCRVRVRVYEPRQADAPAFIAGKQEPRYIFSSGHGRKYQRLDILASDASRLPQDQLYATISKHLPEWSYLYLAPGRVITETGEPVEFPYILNRGEAMLFLVPEK